MQSPSRRFRPAWRGPGPAGRAAEQYGLDARDILVEVGRRKLVGGQDDMIADAALDLVSAARVLESAGS
ncbi:hypothetical protein [Pseudarthrobacter sulfonivorans]|uniref:hypothetical protein n=1 Tax=Pseudarthrobacter sulfonivorans TaxID=121292 RepID=UPI0028578508|nr:hypothetical protein [Pseudarthrobacter sulfonivorans]MDR6415254.1 hypothetical protein [Pseudarthrobacter sulfonivorans]